MSTFGYRSFLMMLLLLLSLSFFVITQNGYADSQEDDFFDTHAQGWHWYEPVPSQPLNTNNNDNPSNTPNSQTPSSGVTSISPKLNQSANLDPLSQVKAISHAVEEAKAMAVLNPTPLNVARYIALQNAITQNAAQFGQVWQHVIWQTPSLNYSLNHPTNQLAKNAYLDTQREQNGLSLKNMASQYGLFFFFAGSCPYCHRFAPIVKDLQTQYGFSVIPVSLDGGNLPEYLHPLRDNGQAAKFGVHQWPALFLVDPNKRQIIPVTFGLISEEELTTRMISLVTQIHVQGKKG